MKNALNFRPSFKSAKVLAIGALLLLAGCGDFGDLNVDPNNPSVVKTNLLLTTAMRSMPGPIGDVTGTLYVQYIAETQYDEAARYQSATFDFNGWYTGPLVDLQTIIDLNTNPDTRNQVLEGGSNNNQIAVARIMRAYYFAHMTDRWGMIPYSESLKGIENLRPTYDSQADIYSSLLNELKEAVGQIDGGMGATGDFVFNGNMNSWKSFANSLRMRLAMRLSDISPSTARTHFTEAASAGFITADVMYPFLGEAANQNPWYSRFETRTDYALSDVMANYMKANDDYRVLKFGDPAPNADNGDGVVTFDEVIGMPYSIRNPGEIENAEISFPGQAIRAQNAPLPIITLAEVNFLMAEAVERGWVSGSASNYYRAAIEASWRQWGVYDAANFNNYMSKTDVVYSSGTWQQKIGRQKWVALFPNGYEAWSEWRRLDYPQLTAHQFPLNSSGKIPVRHAYPSSELQLNENSYKAAVAAQGADTGDTRLWWDIK